MAYKCYRSLIYQSTEPAVIVLEDLGVNGFTKLYAPDDYETTKMIFQRLAVFHAASFYLVENVRKSILFEEEILFLSAFSFLFFVARDDKKGSRFFKLQLLRLPYARCHSRVVLQTQFESFQEPAGGKYLAGAE